MRSPEGPVDVALAVLRRGPEVLLQRRATGPFRGQWELPGGKVQAGESPAAAALREVQEELGIAARAPVLLMVREHRYPGGPWVRLHVFAVETEPVAETADRRFVPLAEAADWQVLEGTRPILEALAAEARP